MESPSSDVFQSRLHKNLSGLRVPTVYLRLRMMPRKIARPLYAVSTERQGKEENIFGKKEGKHCEGKHWVNGTIVTLKRRIQFTALSF